MPIIFETDFNSKFVIPTLVFHDESITISYMKSDDSLMHLDLVFIHANLDKQKKMFKDH